MPTKEEVHNAALVLAAARRDQEGITRSKKSKEPKESPKKEEKKSKKGLIIGIVSALALAGIGVGVYFWVTSNRGPDLTKATIQYEESNGGYKVTGIGNENKSLVKTVTIPNTYNGKPVNEIKAGALGGCANLEEVSLPFIGRNADATGKEGLFGYVFGTEMSEGAGAYTWQQYMTGYDEETGEEKLEYAQAIIPDSLEKVTITGGNVIAPGAFSSCKYISEINIEDTKATEIGNYAFYYCSSIFEFKIPETITKIDDKAFSRNYVLQEVTIPNKVTSLGRESFSNDISVGLVYVPDSVDTIGSKAFYNLQSSLIVCTSPNKKDGWASDWVSDGISISYGTENIVYCENSLVALCSDASGNDKYVYLIQWTGEWETATLNIPDELDVNGGTYPVKVIGARFFEDNNNVCTVNLGKNITSIGSYAFYDCDKLTTFNFAKNFNLKDEKTENKTLTYIGAYAFGNCTSLKGYTRQDEFFDGIVLPNNITEIGNHAFYNCYNITHLRLPNKIDTIGDSCFEGCERLMYGFSEHDMYRNQDAYDRRAVEDPIAHSDNAICVPRSIRIIGKAAFKNCFRLKDDGETSILYPMIYVEDDRDKEGSAKLVEYDDSVFENCGIYTKTGIYSRQIRIDFDLGFAQDPGVNRFGNNCFKDAYMNNFVVRNENLHHVGDYAFYQCRPNFPENAVKICHNVEDIGDYAFYNWTTCAGVYFEGTNAATDKGEEHRPHLKSIGKSAFRGMTNDGFTELIIPYTVETIGEYAFYGCNKVETLEFQDEYDGEKQLPKYKTIEPYTFGNMSNLGRNGKSLNLPQSIKNLEKYCFQNCTSIKEINVGCKSKTEKAPACLDRVSWDVFYNCTSLQTINWNLEACTYFSSSIFYNCTNLITDATATLGKAAAKSIGSSTYANCSKLEATTINGNITSIGSSAYIRCKSLKTVTFEGDRDTNVSIGSYAFKDCENLEQVTFDSHVTSLGEQSFAGCTKLGTDSNKPFTLPDCLCRPYQNLFAEWGSDQIIQFHQNNIHKDDRNKIEDVNVESIRLYSSDFKLERVGKSSTDFKPANGSKFGSTLMTFKFVK